VDGSQRWWRNGSTKTFGYNFASQVLAEIQTRGTLSSWWVTDSYDALMRRTNVQATAGATVEAI